MVRLARSLLMFIASWRWGSNPTTLYYLVLTSVEILLFMLVCQHPLRLQKKCSVLRACLKTCLFTDVRVKQ